MSLDTDWTYIKGISTDFYDLLEQDILKPGFLIRFADGREWLVGNLNADGGTCDCCHVRGQQIVAYKRVWEPEQV